jgi:hypothetical protein
MSLRFVKVHLPIVLILAVAGLSRFWAIGFGLPHPFCRPDESAIVDVTTRFFGRSRNPHFFNYPTLFFYIVAAWTFGYFLVVRAGISFGAGWKALQVSGANLTPIYRIARVSSAAFGVASVWVLYRAAIRLFDRTTALVAAAFLGLAFLHVRDSHFGVSDVAATFFVLVSFLYATRLAESGARGDLIGAGAAAGLAMSTKYNAALAVLPALWVVVGTGGPRRWPVAGRLGRAAALFGLMAVSFAATSPYCVIEFRECLAALRFEAAHLSGGHGAILGRGWIVHLVSSLRYGMGLPLLVAGITGMAMLIRTDWRKGVLIAVFPVSYYALMGGGYTAFARYALPIVPFLCLTAAWAVAELGRWATGVLRRPALFCAATWAVALAVVAPSAWSVVQFDRLLAVTDSRLVAFSWLEQHFPAGASVKESGMIYGHVVVADRPRPASPRYVEAPLTPGVSEPDVVIEQDVAKDPPAEDGGVSPALASRYVLVEKIEAFSEAARANPFDRQDEFYLPLAGFRGISRPGPSFRIYVRRDLEAGVRHRE